MPWSQEGLAIVIKAAELGLTAAQIAAQVGRSRNAVIGLIKRRGIPWNHSSPTARDLRPAQGRPPNLKKLDARFHQVVTPGVMDARLREKIDRRRNEDPPPIVPDEGEPVIEQEKSGKVGLLELRWHHCKYPIGDPTTPQFRYCGLTRVEGRPYCRKHLKLCCTTWSRRWP